MGNSSGKQLRADLPLVVVLGGGYGGINLAQALDEEYNVLVIEARDAMYHSIGAMRAIADPEYAPKILIPYTNTLKNGLVVKGRATKITADAVYIDGHDEPIPFDYLVCATGASYPVESFRPRAASFDKLLSSVEATRADVEKAQNITIVGAGPVGCELSGEIVRKFPEKKVTLISGDPHVLYSPFMKEELGVEWETQVQKVVKPEQFELLLGHFVNLDKQKEEGYIVTEKGTKVKSDYMFWAVGTKPTKENAGLFSDALKDAFDEKTQQLKVDEHLRVEGHKNIFAVGDLALVKDLRTAIVAQNHAGHVVKVIKALHTSSDFPKAYEAGPPMMFVPFGEVTGAMVMAGDYTKGEQGVNTVKAAKGADMLAARFWETWGSDIKDENPKYEIGDVKSEEFKAAISAYKSK